VDEGAKCYKPLDLGTSGRGYGPWGGMEILARQRLNKYGIKLLAGKLRKIN